VAFAQKLNVIQKETTFIASDGLHYAKVEEDGLVSLQMIDVSEIKSNPNYSFLNTGSPHHVQIVDDLKSYNVKENGSAIRHSKLYGKEGCNINFVNKLDEGTFYLRTYERGVEDETLACGTGATAVAIAMNASGQTALSTINLIVQGGKLAVSFQKIDGKYTNVFLKGPADFVFKGTIEI
jgi:diaminopimelate epimerase